MFPVLLIPDPLLENHKELPHPDSEASRIARELREIQWTDWTALRPTIEASGAESDAVMAAVRALAADVAAALSKPTLPEPDAPAAAAEDEDGAPRRRRRVENGPAPRIPDSPAALEITSREGNAIRPDEIDVIVESRIGTIQFECESGEMLEIAVKSARVVVDWWGGQLEGAERDALDYQLNGVWQATAEAGDGLSGDVMPAGPLCRLVNCETEAGAQVSLVAAKGDLRVVQDEQSRSLFDKLFSGNPTQARLAALYLAEAALPTHKNNDKDHVLAVDSLVTRKEES